MSSRVKTVSKNSSKGVVELTDDSDVNSMIIMNELVIMFFYQEYLSCKAYNEEFDETIKTVKKAYPRLKNVVIGKINWSKEKKLVSRFGCYYPELLIYRNGQELKKIFRAKIDKCIFAELEDPIKPFSNIEELDNFDRTKHLIIGYFDDEDMPEYKIFRRVAHNLKDFCQFAVRYGYFFDKKTSNHKRPPNQPTIISKCSDTTTRSSDNRETYKGCAKNYDELNLWAHKKCMVRELTSENCTELKKYSSNHVVTLFYNPKNTAVIKDFKNIVGKDLMNQKYNVYCFTADGLKFSGYLRELGFNKKHLPFIESNGFIFPDFKDIYSVGKLKAFAVNYHTGQWGKSFKVYVKSNIKKITSKH